MKNFLLEKVAGRRSSWVLLSLHEADSSNVEYKPFTDYVEWLEFTKGYASATVEQYAGHVARFIDFVYEASTMNLKASEISDVLYYYQDYLLYARESENPFVLELCERLGKKKATSVISVSHGIESAISGFITLQIVKSESIDKTNVFSKFVCSGLARSSSEKAAIKSNSWLAGNIRGSLERSYADKRKARVFSISKRVRDAEKKKYDNKEDYPLELVEALLTLYPKRRAVCFHREWQFTHYWLR